MKDDTLDSLMSRLEVEECLATFGLKAGNDVGHEARREAETVSDRALLPQFELHVKNAKGAREIRTLAFILSHYILNTGSEEAKALYEKLIRRAPRSTEAAPALINGAARARLASCREYVLRHIDSSDGPIVSEIIAYLAAMHTPEDVRLLCQLLDRDCNHACHPMSCILALEEIGDRSCMPSLERLVDRYWDGRRSTDSEIVLAARRCLDSLAARGSAE